MLFSTPVSDNLEPGLESGGYRRAFADVRLIQMDSDDRADFGSGDLYRLCSLADLRLNSG
jgi:hypothetical protein